MPHDGTEGFDQPTIAARANGTCVTLLPAAQEVIDGLRKAHAGNLRAVLDMVISHQGLKRKVRRTFAGHFSGICRVLARPVALMRQRASTPGQTAPAMDKPHGRVSTTLPRTRHFDRRRLSWSTPSSRRWCCRPPRPTAPTCAALPP